MPNILTNALNPKALQAMGRSLKGLGSGAGMGALVGSGAGALVGGARNYERERAEGSSTGEAALHSLGGAVRGATKGALVGAAAGGAGGALRPGTAQALARAPGFGGAARFGQRQVHALTGIGDSKYIRRIGGGSADAALRMRDARGALWNASGGAAGSAMKELDAARKGLQASRKAEELGLTSLPGYARALFKNPKEALKAGFGEQWHNAGPGTKALMYGLPAAGVVGEATKPADDDGTGRFERVGKSLGAGLGFAAGPLPFAGQAVLSPTLAKGLGEVGEGVDRALLRRRARRERPMPAPPSLDPAGGSAALGHEDYVVTDRAMGNIPEGA